MNDPFSLDGRLTTLEREILSLKRELNNIRKGKRIMGVALWCQPGDHSFDENDKGKKRIVTDDENENEITIYICSRHVQDFLKPRAKSLESIRQEINEATVIE